MLRFTHTKNVKGRLTKCSLPTEIPQTVNGTGHTVCLPPPKLDHFIRLAWRRCIITHVTLHAPAAVLVAVTVLCGATAELRPGER